MLGLALFAFGFSLGNTLGANPFGIVASDWQGVMIGLKDANERIKSYALLCHPLPEALGGELDACGKWRAGSGVA